MAQRDLSPFVQPCGEGLLRLTVVVDGVHCGGCIGRIESALRKLAGVVEARLNFTNRRLTLVWQAGAAEPDILLGALERLGYRAHPFETRTAEEQERRHAQMLLRCLAVAGFAAMNVMLLSVSVWSGNATDISPETRDLFHWASALIALPAAAYAGRPFFLSALTALRARSVNMDVPISLGVILALGISLFETAQHAEHAYFDSAVMLLFFLLCGRYLDSAMRQRTRAVAGNLAALKAETAQRIDPDGAIVAVPSSVLKAGDRVLVRAGDRVPADGIVESGSSEIDDGLVTGESAPRAAGPSSKVYAGSVNLAGALTVRITAAGADTLIDEIERLMAAAGQAKSSYVRLAERAARAYAPVVHTAAALTLAGWLAAGASLHVSVLVAVSVLIITCPCALALAVPAVQVVTAGRLFRHGVLLNAGDAIERLAEVDTVIFDKTGTLTLPEPRVANAGAVRPDLLDKAARLALSSRHPLAAAVARHAGERQPLGDVHEEPGRGLCATIDGVQARLGSPDYCGVVLSDEDRESLRGASCIAFRYGDDTVLFTVRQTLRPDAGKVVAGLRALGLDVRILSGDHPEAVEPVAAALGVADWAAECKPAEKVAALRDLKAGGRRVLMVGDGINDAPSLIAAHASLSPITAADLSQAQADAVFLGEPLAPVLEAVTTARRARALMMQNFWLAALYNAVAVPVAVAGLVTPLIAAAAMSGSSLLVSLNALRVRPALTRPAAAGGADAPCPLPDGALT